MADPYYYDDCEVLKNKLGIKDEAELERAEVDFSCNAIHELSLSPLPGNYDFKHYCDFHAYIFKDIYEWAGIPRFIGMGKMEAVIGYTSIEYAEPDEISELATDVLEVMNGRNWDKMSLEEQAKNLTHDMADLWKVHSFREGNTRTTITFFCQFTDSKGMSMDRELFEKHSAYTRTALVAATAVFEDGDFRQTEYLYKIVKESLERGRQNDRKQEKRMGMVDWKSQITQMNKGSSSEKEEMHTNTKNNRNER